MPNWSEDGNKWQKNVHVPSINIEQLLMILYTLIEQTVKWFDACEGSLGENERKFALYSKLLTELLKASL